MENENRSSMFINFVAVVSIASAVGLSYLSFMNWQNAYSISKAQFICTKIQQVGKNLDDVICVQYTNQKFQECASVTYPKQPAPLHHHFHGDKAHQHLILLWLHLQHIAMFYRLITYFLSSNFI